MRSAPVPSVSARTGESARSTTLTSGSSPEKFIPTTASEHTADTACEMLKQTKLYLLYFFTPKIIFENQIKTAYQQFLFSS
jgi:hypothetical protein